MPRLLLSTLAAGALLAGAIVTAAGPTVAQDATPAAGCPVTTPEENKALVEQWFAALSSGMSEELAAIAAEDIVYHDALPDEDAEEGGAQEWAEERREDYPDHQVTVMQMIAEGDMVAAYNRYVGTHQGDVEEGMGVPATGLEAEWGGMAIFRVECGQIAELWSVSDQLGRLMQIGAITEAEVQSVEPVATPAS